MFGSWEKMDTECSEGMASEVLEMCENLEKRDFEAAVMVLDKGSSKVLTYGTSIGTSFFLGKPDVATMFQDFCEIYSDCREGTHSDVVSDTGDSKGENCEVRNNTEQLEHDNCKDSSEADTDTEKECNVQSSGQESYLNNEMSRADTFEESKRITRQSKKSLNINVEPRGRTKKMKSFREVKCLERFGDCSQALSETSKEKDDETEKQTREVKAKPTLKNSVCKRPCKGEAELSADDASSKVSKMNCGNEVSLSEYSEGNLQLHYFNKDGNKTSGERSSMYEEQTIDKSSHFFCKICSYSTTEYNVMIEHTQTHVLQDVLACGLCHKMFQSKKSLWRHTNQHKKLPHMCKVCLRMYGTTEELREHEITHKPSHECSVCNRTYDSVGRLNYHIKTSHGPKQNTCEICGSSFTSKSLLRQHKKRHGPKQFFCDKCSCSYYFLHQLTNHLKKHDENSFKYKCNVCMKEYVTKSHWKEHMKLHDGSNFVQCDQCGKSYNSRKSLNLHKISKHVDERKFICQICGKAFITKHHLKNHLISHDDKRDYKCRFCDATFKKNDVLKMHENVHTQEQKFMCDICGEHFLRRSSLRNHHLTHFPGHQRWKCRYCDDKFRTQSAMLTHIKNKHADVDLSHDRPFCKRCEQCGKVFAKGLAFRIHMDMHAGIKRHKCRICGNAFTDPANLRVHQKIHSGSSKEYVCESCDCRFSSVKQYTVHMQQHCKYETQTSQHSNGKSKANLKQMQVKPDEERNEAQVYVLRPDACGSRNHVDASVTELGLGTLDSNQEQKTTNQRHANTNHNIISDNCLKESPNFQTSNSCPEMIMNSSHAMVIAGISDVQLRQNAALCSNAPNQTVAGSLRQGMDIKNYDHIQLYYSAMF